MFVTEEGEGMSRASLPSYPHCPLSHGYIQLTCLVLVLVHFGLLVWSTGLASNPLIESITEARKDERSKR